MTKQPFKYSISDFSGKSISVKQKQVASDYRLHWHNCCELELIIEGCGSQVLNDTEYELSPGTLYLLTQADCHSIRVKEPLTVLGIMFEEKLISQPIYERILTLETKGQNLTALLSDSGFLAARAFMSALMKEDARSERDFSESEFGGMYVNHMIDCLLIELLRSCEPSRNDSAVARADSLGSAILYLHSHFDEAVTLDRLAEITHLSRSYFSELFKQSTGSTFKGYLINLRLRNACRLLANTDMSVTDVCYESGFQSFSNFMRTFKTQYGMTPLAFRSAMKSGRSVN